MNEKGNDRMTDNVIPYPDDRAPGDVPDEEILHKPQDPQTPKGWGEVVTDLAAFALMGFVAWLIYKGVTGR